MNTAAFALACTVLLSESEPSPLIMVSTAVVFSESRNMQLRSIAIRARQEQRDVVLARLAKRAPEFKYQLTRVLLIAR